MLWLMETWVAVQFYSVQKEININAECECIIGKAQCWYGTHANVRYLDISAEWMENSEGYAFYLKIEINDEQPTCG